MKIQLSHSYNDITSLENLLEAWSEFIKDKRSRKDVQAFERDLMASIISLHSDLNSFSYKHSKYTAFNISDPKPRRIHKALVRDRVLHHAVYRKLYPFFDRTFIADSFSCRIGKGTHKAMDRFNIFARKVSRNNTKTCWVLKGDIKKFFDSIDHRVLLEILAQHILDFEIMLLLQNIIESFSVSPGKGLPLGNLTSQLFCNVYMNRFDQFVKHTLHAQYYIRYADDFVILSENKDWIQSLIPKISQFLEDSMKLSLHPNKLFIKTFASGVDFLGWVHFPNHRVVRTTTKRRMLRRIRQYPMNETLQSYLGLLGHGDASKVARSAMNEYELAKKDFAYKKTITFG
jgi:RNA-directed DNA polymerase